MNRSLIFLVALLLAHTAMADRIVIFNSTEDWPESVDMETSFGPMPTGYYNITKDGVEVEFQMNDEMENEYDAYYYQGKMNIYSISHGIKMVSFSYPRSFTEASFTLLYDSNYNYVQNTIPCGGAVEGLTTVFEFFDTYREYVGLVGRADLWTITVTVDDGGLTGVPEAVAPRTVASVRYFNMAGQELRQPRGLVIELTTYTDCSTSVEKCVK